MCDLAGVRDRVPRAIDDFAVDAGGIRAAAGFDVVRNLACMDVVDELLKFPVTPGVKALIAQKTGDPEWLRARPPLVAMKPAEAALLTNAFAAIFAEKAA